MKKNSLEIALSRLNHILDSISAIEKYTKDINCNEFVSDSVVRDAVLYNFSVIGEAIAFVDKSVLEMSDYPWYKVRSFRNFIAHEYFNIKPEAVWMIIEKNLAELKSEIALLIRKLNAEIGNDV